ncbi:MAG: hypothetical protein CMM50_08515 [Rhodospirillaceae bacterium]|nr:hypothetical protein [Rhodospirillaceae bacterium]
MAKGGGNAAGSRRRVRLTEMRVAALAAAVTLIFYFAISQTTPLRGIEGLLLDMRFLVRGAQQPSDDVVVVLVDDKSINEIGRWPWSRSVFAEMVDKLSAAGARLIAIDMLFVTAERSITGQSLDALIEVLQTLDTDGPDAAVAQFRTALPRLDNHGDAAADLRFADAIARAGNVIVPFAFVFPSEVNGPGIDPERLKESAVPTAAFRNIRLREGEAPRFALATRDVLAPVPEVGQAAQALGHVNVALDVDGTARFEYPVLEYKGDYYPAFGVQIAREALALAPEEMAFIAGEGIRIGPLFVPTDEVMRMLANYYGPEQTFTTIPFTDAFNGRVPPKTFKDKIVLMGANATGVSDVFETPFSAVVPGVERNATVVDNILTGRHLVRRDSFAAIDVAFIVVGCLLIGWAGRRLPSLKFSFASLVIGTAFVAINYAFFAFGGMWLNLTFPLVGFLLAYSAVTIHVYFSQEERERTIRNAFDRYLHPAVVQTLCDNPGVLTLGGESKTLTVLFSDVRNFSSIAAELPAEQLVGLMNSYFTAQSDEVLKSKGLLDKYIGDGLMAVWGAPLPTPPGEQAYLACETALAMVASLDALQDQWKRHGFGSLRIGVGINTGEMIIGNMGSSSRFNYTVMGDEVNVASRLEQYNKVMGTTIICSEQTATHVGDRLSLRELDLVVVKGRPKPVRLFEVLGKHPIDPDWAEAVKQFEDGLFAYRRRQWSTAAAYFEEVLRWIPGDRPSEIFLDRCRRFAVTPPPEDWGGVAPDVPARPATAATVPTSVVLS